MTLPGKGEAPQDVAAYLDARQEEFADALTNLEDRVAEMATRGAAQPEIDDFKSIGDRLQSFGEMVLRTAAVIEETEIPVQVEEEPLDEERAYQIARQFIEERGYNSPFSKREVREHLRNNGIQVEARKFGRMFDNWRTEIEADKRDEGFRVRFERIPPELGFERGTYALAQLNRPIGRPVETPVEVPEPLPAETAVPVHLDPEVADRTTEAVTAAALQLVQANPDARARDHIRHLAELSGMAETDAKAVFESLMAAPDDDTGQPQLYKVRVEGTLKYSLQPVDKTKKPAVQEKNAEREQLTERNEVILREMLAALSRFSVNTYEQGLTARDIERYITLKDPAFGLIGSRRINRLARIAEVTGVIKSWQSRKGTGGSQFRVGAADKRMHGIIKNHENWDAIVEAVKEERPLEVPEA
ncbi:MAG TPA: hypothetical protein VK978_03810 [Candidatus Saccharimonadales bacterium]|nr:hypothetical protein [Candidatus Saccharimonadales bacterium]